MNELSNAGKAALLADMKRDAAIYVKAELFENNTGEIAIESGDSERVFTFLYTENGTLSVKDDSGDVICSRSLQDDNGEQKNAVEAFGIAVQEVGGYFD